MDPKPVPEIVSWGSSCGRVHLDLLGVTVAMEGDTCRETGKPWTDAQIKLLAYEVDVAIKARKCGHDLAREFAGACKKHGITECMTCETEEAKVKDNPPRDWKLEFYAYEEVGFSMPLIELHLNRGEAVLVQSGEVLDHDYWNYEPRR